MITNMFRNTQAECEWSVMITIGKHVGCKYGWTKCGAPQAKGFMKLRCPHYWPPFSVSEETPHVAEGTDQPSN